MWNIDKALKLKNHPGSLLEEIRYLHSNISTRSMLSKNLQPLNRNSWRIEESEVTRSTKRRDKYPEKDGSTM